MLQLGAGLWAAAAVVGAVQAEPSLARLYAETGGFTSGQIVQPEALPDGKTVIYLRSGPRDRILSLYGYDLEARKETLLVSPEQLSVELGAAKRGRSADKSIDGYQLSADGRRVLLNLGGRLYVLDLAARQARALVVTGAVVEQGTFSPDNAKVAYVQDHDVCVVDLASNVRQVVTTGGTAQTPHGVSDYSAVADMGRPAGYWWSPDSRLIAFVETSGNPADKLLVQDPGHPEAEPSPLYFARPTSPAPQTRLGIVPAGGGRIVWTQWDQKKYPYLVTVRWSDNAPLTILVQNRPQTEEVLYSVEAASGAVRRLLGETQKAWLNVDQDFPLWLDDGAGFFWRSERTGAAQIEFHAKDGGLNAVWVAAGRGVNSLAGFDFHTRNLFVNASPSPVESYVVRIFAGGLPQRLDAGLTGKCYDTAKLSRDGAMIFVRTNSLAQMPATQVWRKDGTNIGTLPSVALDPMIRLDASVQQAGDAVQVWTLVVRPRDFAAGKKYPVLLHVDGGPGEHLVRLTRAEHLMLQWFADRGYIVVEIDGRGSDGRGKTWEAALLYDFSSVIAQDQIMGLNALAPQFPEMDLSRVGIWGWSFGGYVAALLVMRHPELFGAATAGTPIADWRDYQARFTERYLKAPADNAAGYDASSLLTYAANLSRPLLIVQGTADSKVFFAQSLKLADALLRSGHAAELLPVLGQGHDFEDPQVVEEVWQRIAAFFADKLR